MLPHGKCMDMTVHREVNVRHKHINVARKTLIFKVFQAKLCQTLFEISKLNLSCTALLYCIALHVFSIDFSKA